MEIPPVNSATSGAVVSAPTPTADSDVPSRELVAAVRQINKAELMGEGRELTFTRDPETRQRVIQIIEQSTGEVVDQLPPETVLRLAQQLK